MTQKFGSGWTVLKLDAVEEYLSAYTTALKDKFKLCYIDAFAGSGSVVIKDGRKIQGSAVRALKYPFDKFHFFETDAGLLDDLKAIAGSNLEHRDVEFHDADCNSFLVNINKQNWKKQGWRGVVFLDPFAMNLAWECLKSISETQAFDVWYLFPFSAVNRNLNKDGNIPSSNRKLLDYIFGTEDWDSKIYFEDPQTNMFGERRIKKVNSVALKQYIISRLKDTFSTVSDKSVFLKNETQSPLFLLCFAGGNPNAKAKELSLTLANHILSRM